MSRKPLVVAVDCDECGEGVVFHGKGQEITVSWLEENLKQHGWSKDQSTDTGLERDLCPDCTKVEADRLDKIRKKPKKKR